MHSLIVSIVFNMYTYQIKVYKSLTGNFIRQWKELWSHSKNANVHNSYQRFLICVETYNIKDYEIYACYRNKKLVALMPVCSYRRFGIKVTGSVANNVYYNTSFLIKDYTKDLFKYFFMHVIPKSNFYITRVDSRSAEILKLLFPKLLLSVMAGIPYLDLNNDPLRFIPQSTLKKVRKILEKHSGKFKFEIYDDNLEDLLKTIFLIERNSSKRLRTRDIFSKKDRREYFKNLVRYGHKLANIAMLYYQNIPIAYSFNLNYGNMFHCAQKAHLNEYKKFMPGKIVAVLLLESLRNTRVERIDFGAGVDSFKQELTPVYYLIYDMYFSKNIFVMFWWRSINAIRRLKKILVPERFTRDPEFLFRTL